MAGFLRWIAPQMPTRAQRLTEELIRFRQLWSEKKAHSRTPDNLANLNLGLRLWLDFAQHIGAITSEEAFVLECSAEAAFADVAAAQADIQEHVDPVKQFLDLIVAAFTSGRAHLLSLDGSCPYEPSKWGWTFAAGDWRPQGECIGWVDSEAVYLQWKAAFAVAQQIGRDVGEQIQVTINTLGKRLRQAEMLKAYDDSRNTNYVRKRIQGVDHKVWQISPEGLYLQN